MLDLPRFSTGILCLLLLAAAAACVDAGDYTRDAPDGSPTDARTDTTFGPSHPAYDRLQEALARYREIERQGGWPEVPSGDLVQEGDTSARVLALRERLALTGDLSEQATAEQDSVYDEQLTEAVRRFQRRHGLAEDGLLGPGTLAVLNTPVEERTAQIRRSLERWHDLPEDLGDRYILVNIPEFRLRAFENGREALQMKVIVGGEFDDRATPTFRDTMDHVIFNPYWNIPESIAEDEILPEAREDRDYLVENDYEIVSHYAPDAKVYDPFEADLDRVATGELRLRQKPGPQNALGRVKFMFPNDYAVYLHDTPEEHLFEETERAFSHGCIRVERPVDLAAFVFSGQPEWTRERIEDAMQRDERQRVDVTASIPIYILYWTAYADDTGAVQFREDLYGRLNG